MSYPRLDVQADRHVQMPVQTARDRDVVFAQVCGTDHHEIVATLVLAQGDKFPRKYVRLVDVDSLDVRVVRDDVQNAHPEVPRNCGDVHVLREHVGIKRRQLQVALAHRTRASSPNRVAPRATICGANCADRARATRARKVWPPTARTLSDGKISEIS